MSFSDRDYDIEQLHEQTIRPRRLRANGRVVTSTPRPADEKLSTWPDPAPLPCGLLPVRSLDPVMIPAPLRRWLVDIAERIQCPLEFPAMGAVVALASVIGRHIGMRPKRFDDWLVIANLWGVAIGRPGILKSPALAEVLKPLFRLEAQAREQYTAAMERFEFDKTVMKARQDEQERRIREAVKKALNLEEARAQYSFPGGEEPVPARYVVNDSTVEKIGVILNQNPNDILVFRDELTGWLRTLDREGHENDRAFYLESWNGNGAYTYDRIGRGTLYIPACCISILGSIQPGPLADYLRAAVRGGNGDDGLVQRFQLAVYPDDLACWKNVDRWPDGEAKNAAFNIFQWLATLDPATIGATVADGEDIPFLHFTPAAQDLFNTWRGDLERKIHIRENHPAIEAHLSKYRSLMPALALLFHLVDAAAGKSDTGTKEVSEQAAKMATAWCDFLEAHARRIYQSVTQHALFAARALADRIQANKLPNPFTLHNVYHNAWTGLASPQEVRDAAEVLEGLNWVRSETISPGQQGGRPWFHYCINPRLKRPEPRT